MLINAAAAAAAEVKDWIEVSNWFAGDSSIFKVGTVMITKWVTATVDKSSLSPSTGHLV